MAATHDHLQLQQVVMLFRHGVRAPLDGEVGAAGRNRQPLPAWSTSASLLTPHGREGMRLLGVYDRQWLAAQGVLPAHGCPSAGQVQIHTNTEERTIASGEAWARGLAPRCRIQLQHQALNSDDPLFHPIEAGVVPFVATAAVRSVMAQTSGPAVVAAPYAAAIQTMQAVLGCNDAGCDIAKVPASLVPSSDGRGMGLQGPIQITSGTAQVFLLQYAEGMPLAQVGWGRATRARITQMSRLHALLFDIYARPDYMAQRIGGPLVQWLLATMAQPSSPQLSVLVASDNNIAAVTALLGVHFQIDSYGLDDPPPGGALGFQILRDTRTGTRYVKVFYQAQTLDQLRQLSPLSLTQPPVLKTLKLTGCKPSLNGLCALDDFSAWLTKRAQIRG